ncbi:MAG: molybdopterin molybdotransferase MoeA [Verrucomicrobiota bacterium]
MNPLVTPEEADRLISTALPVTCAVNVPVETSAGMILREPIIADRPQPPYRRATMDGIAFQSKPEISSWIIAGLHAAGDPPPRLLAIGEAWEIMTGAQVPDDCDTVAPYENVTISDRIAVLSEKSAPDRFIHAMGADAPAGDALVPAGAMFGPLEIAIAVSTGHLTPLVSSRPKISILTTGDEAISADASPLPWQIRRSNGPMLAALLRSDGCELRTHEHVVDDPDALDRAFESALNGSDVVLVCGGISKGKRDFTRTVISSRCGEPAFHGVSQRPGKPLAFWNGAPPVFALPGNPISVLATYVRFVRPALLRMQGAAPAPPFAVRLAEPFEPLAHLSWHVPARIDGDLARCLLPLNSGDFITSAGATHLLEFPPGNETLAPSAIVAARPLFSFSSPRI